MTAIHFPTDPVPALPVSGAPATRPHLLQRFFRWIDDRLPEVDGDD